MKTKKSGCDCKNSCACSGNSIVRSKGEYTIIVVRKGFKIKKDLPYTIFGTIYLNGQNFSTAVKDYLPVGVTCTSAIVGDRIIFTYTEISTGFIDKITIAVIPNGIISYPQFLANLNTNYLKTELIYFCNNVVFPNQPILTVKQNQTIQAQPLFLQRLSGMSQKDIELITPISRKLPNNTITDIIELSMKRQDIRAETVWIHKFAYIKLTEKDTLVFYWQIVINDIINLNEERQNTKQIEEETQ